MTFLHVFFWIEFWQYYLVPAYQSPSVAQVLLRWLNNFSHSHHRSPYWTEAMERPRSTDYRIPSSDVRSDALGVNVGYRRGFFLVMILTGASEQET